MDANSTALDALVEHHGHLGGFDVLGFKGGLLILEALNARRHFGLHITVWCPPQPPHSCLLDGLQLATGCTMGKRNLVLRPSTEICLRAVNIDTAESVLAVPKPEAVHTILQLTAAQGPESAGRWAWEREPTELWQIHERTSASSPARDRYEPPVHPA